MAESMTASIAGSLIASLPQSRDASMVGSMTASITESMAEIMGFPGVCDLGGYSRLDSALDSLLDPALDSTLDSVSYPTFSTPAQCIGWPVVASKACAASAVESRVRRVSAQVFTSLERSPAVLESSLSVSR